MKNICDIELGILGGGQLGKMLLQEASKIGIKTNVLDKTKNVPSSSFCNNFTVGNYMDYDDVYNFGKNLDYITIEIEHVNTTALSDLEKKGVKVYPKSSSIEIIKNKSQQKYFYIKNNIPTANYTFYKSKNELNKNSLKYPKIWKSCTLGYDGKGVAKINTEKDFKELPETNFILEEKVDIKKEISVIACRGVDGKISCYPPVEMDFVGEANILSVVKKTTSLDKKTIIEAKEIANKIISKLDIVGLLAVEMFITKDNKIIVNEVAPRPHNSGHLTIEGSSISQYQAHLRAILEIPFNNLDILNNSGMFNILGEKNSSGKVLYKGLDKVLSLENTFVHIYGKKETSSYRKLGHVTILENGNEKLNKKLDYIKKTLVATSC